MRHICLLLLLLAGGPVLAQAPLRTPRPDTVAATAPSTAAPDTVAAIHRLFSARRRQSAVVIGGTVGIGLICLAVAENTRHTSNFDIPATPLIATGISLLSIPATAVEVIYYRRFTRRKEAKALRALTEHRLPRRTRRQLKSEYFQPDKRPAADPFAH